MLVTGDGPLVGVIMGSTSDWETMQHAVETLEALDVPHEVRVVSAHRTPDLLMEYAGSAEERGLQVIIAGAGGAAHLPADGIGEDRPLHLEIGTAGDRCAGGVADAEGDGLVALHRPDASRGTGRDAGDWSSGRSERGAAGGVDAGGQPPPDS